MQISFSASEYRHEYDHEYHFANIILKKKTELEDAEQRRNEYSLFSETTYSN